MTYMIWSVYFQNGDLRPWDLNKVPIQILYSLSVTQTS